MNLYNYGVNFAELSFIKFNASDVMFSVTDINGNKVIRIDIDSDMYCSLKNISQGLTVIEHQLYYILQYDAGSDVDFIMYKVV